MCKKITIFMTVLVTLLLAACHKTDDQTKDIHISVAASLVPVMNEIIEEYKKEVPIDIHINSGGSGTLKKQISQGAEVGLFFSADEKYVDQLIEEGLILANKKDSTISNTLVLIKSEDAPSISTLTDLAKQSFTLAIGDVSTVPAGEYAKESFVNLNLWEKLNDSLIYAKDVTAVKTYVERGEVDYGVIYQTDALTLTKASVVLPLPQDSYEPIVYSLAPIEGYKNQKECEALMDFILSNTGKNILKSYGFDMNE